MPVISANLISIIVFYSLVALFFYIKRKKITVQSKLIFLYKTKFFNKLIRRIARKAPKFWRALGYLAIPVGFLGMIAIFGYLTLTLVKLFAGSLEQAPLSLVIPGVRLPGTSFFIPFWYGIISLFVVILVHEGAHGVVSEALGNKIKSAGFGFFTFLPIAFVEPNESKLKKQPVREQLAIFSAGAFANLATAGLVFLMALFLVAPVANAVVEPAGLTVTAIRAGFPAEAAGLQKGMIIKFVDNHAVSKADDFIAYMQGISPGQIINLVADNQSFSLKTVPNPENISKAFIGVSLKQNLQIKESVKTKYGEILPWMPWRLLELFFWIFTLNLGIGAINLIPLGPIDGGRMAKAVIDKKFKNKKKAKKLFWLISIASLALLIANLVGPFLAKVL